MPIPSGKPRLLVRLTNEIVSHLPSQAPLVGAKNASRILTRPEENQDRLD